MNTVQNDYSDYRAARCRFAATTYLVLLLWLFLAFVQWLIISMVEDARDAFIKYYYISIIAFVVAIILFALFIFIEPLRFTIVVNVIFAILIVELQIIAAFTLVARSKTLIFVYFFIGCFLLLWLFILIGSILPRSCDLTLDVAILFILALIFILVALYFLVYRMLLFNVGTKIAYIIFEVFISLIILSFVMYHAQTINGSRYSEMRLNDAMLGSVILFHDFLIIFWLTFHWQYIHSYFIGAFCKDVGFTTTTSRTVGKETKRPDNKDPSKLMRYEEYPRPRSYQYRGRGVPPKEFGITIDPWEPDHEPPQEAQFRLGERNLSPNSEWIQDEQQPILSRSGASGSRDIDASHMPIGNSHENPMQNARNSEWNQGTEQPVLTRGGPPGSRGFEANHLARGDAHGNFMQEQPVLTRGGPPGSRGFEANHLARGDAHGNFMQEQPVLTRGGPPGSRGFEANHMARGDAHGNFMQDARNREWNQGAEQPVLSRNGVPEFNGIEANHLAMGDGHDNLMQNARGRGAIQRNFGIGAQNEAAPVATTEGTQSDLRMRNLNSGEVGFRRDADSATSAAIHENTTRSNLNLTSGDSHTLNTGGEAGVENPSGNQMT